MGFTNSSPFRNQWECVFVVSIELNIFGLIYMLTKRFISLYCTEQSNGLKTDMKLFPCEDLSKSQCKQKQEHLIARGIVNSICSTIIFGLAMDIIFSTDFITNPFIGINNRVEFGIASLISLCIFNLLLTLTTGLLRKGKVHCICKHILGIGTLLISLHFDENSLSGVLAMVIIGSVFIDELKLIFQIYEKYDHYNCYNAFSLFHLLVNFLCQLFLPIIIIILTLIYTKQRFFDTEPLIQTVFFLSVTFFFWYNIWLLRKMTYSYIAERAKLYIIRRTNPITNNITAITNFNMFTEWGNKEYRHSLEKRVEKMESNSSTAKEDNSQWTTIDLNF